MSEGQTMVTKTKKKKKKKKSERDKWPNHSYSLSPFYSFENHWLHLSRKYLCLTTWGTCMGGINEQFDDMLEYEATGDWVHKTHEKALKKWNQQRQTYGKYPPPMTTKGFINTNQRTAHYQPQIKRSKVNYTMQHKLLEYQYPNKNIKPVSNQQGQNDVVETNGNKNVFVPLNEKYAQVNQRRKAVHSLDEAQEMQTKKAKEKEIEIKNNEKTLTAETIATAQSNKRRGAVHSFMASNESKMKKIEIDEKELSDEETSPLILPMDQMQRRESQHIIGAQSMDRKLSEFNKNIEMKRRSTMKDLEWQKQHNKNFEPMDDDGIDVIDKYTAYPVGRGVVKKRPRTVSKVEKSAYMKSKEDENAIEYHDKLATMDTKSKIRLMNQLSVERTNNG